MMTMVMARIVMMMMMATMMTTKMVMRWRGGRGERQLLAGINQD